MSAEIKKLPNAEFIVLVHKNVVMIEQMRRTLCREGWYPVGGVGEKRPEWVQVMVREAAPKVNGTLIPGRSVGQILNGGIPPEGKTAPVSLDDEVPEIPSEQKRTLSPDQKQKMAEGRKKYLEEKKAKEGETK